MEITRIVTVKSAAPGMGATDVLNDGTLYKNSPAPSVLVPSEADLGDLPEYPAGTIAYTAGFKAMWQLDAAGDWIAIV